MATQKEPDRENTIVIRDRRKPNQYTTDNVIAREWLPILRVGDAFFFYSVYLSMANRETESSWGSLRTMAQYLQCGIDLIIRGNKLLEICELIYIDPGNQYTSNEYYILDPPPLTPELAARIDARLDELEAQEVSKNWQSWINQVRKAMARHRSLPDIWAARRANRGGRPTKRGEGPTKRGEGPTKRGEQPTVQGKRPTKRGEGPTAGDEETTESTFTEKGDREPQTGLLPEKGDRDSQAGYTCDTSGVVVSHTQGDRDSQAEQEQVTRQTNKNKLRKKDSLESLLVLEKCRALGIAPTVLGVLIEQYPLDRLERQLAWLPARKPRDPAALFVRAVQEDWSQPAHYAPKETKEIWERWLEDVGGDKGHEEKEKGEGKRKVRRSRGEGIGEKSQGDGKKKGGTGEEQESADLGNGERGLEMPGTGQDVQQVWRRVLHELEMQMTRVTFDTWLRGTQAMGVRENGIVVQVRDGYAVEWLQARLSVAIRRTLAGITGQPVEVYFEVA
jgi:hypothetical protein